MNDQPLNDTELDDRIRSLVVAAVAEAPAPHPFPSNVELMAAHPSRSRRVLVFAGIGVAASLIAVAVVWSTRSDTDRVIPASNLDLPTTVSSATDWPSGIAVVVASERGIEKIGPDGTTTVPDTDGTVRAYELADGSLIYQRGALTTDVVVGGGDIMWRSEDGSETNSLVTAGDTQLQLFDASLVNGDLGRLQLVYGVAGSDGDTVAAWFQPDEPHSWVPEGGWAVGYRRWNIAGPDRVLAGWTDDTGQTGASTRTATGDVMNVVDHFAGALRVVAAPDGRTGRLDDDGVLTLFDPDGAVSTVIVPNADDGVDLQLRGAALVVNYATSRSALLIDLRDGATYEVRTNGYVTPSMAVNAVMPPPTENPTVGDVRAVLSRSIAGSDGGVWVVQADGTVTKVASDTDGPAFLVGDSHVYSRKGGGVVLQAADGSTMLLRTTGVVQDAALLGGELFYLLTDTVEGDGVSLYLHGPGGETYITLDRSGDTGHSSWHLGRDAIVGTSAYYAGMVPAIYDLAGNELVDVAELAGPPNRDPLTGNLIVYTMNADGLWGSLDGQSLTLRQWGSSDVVDSITLPERAVVSRIDVAEGSVLVTYFESGVKLATKNSNGQWVWETLESGDWATLPRATDPGAPTIPLTAPAAPDPYVALAGSFGVKIIDGPTTSVVSTSPATRVVRVGDGSVLYRAPDEGGYPRRWDPATGESRELWPGTNFAGEPLIHDDMRDVDNFLYSVRDRVYDYGLGRSWALPAQPADRLSYASNGWIVGDGVRLSIGDTQPPDWIGGDGLWALSPAGDLVASYVDGVVQVRRLSDGVVLYERMENDLAVTEIDVNTEWLSIAETPKDTPYADSTSRVVLVHMASGRFHTYDGAVSASLPDKSL